MKKQKISFIIPVYNIKNYIEKCVNSILNQNNEIYDKEIIIVNDGSTDGVEDVFNNFNDNNIIIINKKNGGLSSARNAGLKVATGDYIWFVDGDDYIENNSFEILQTNIKNKEYDIVYFNYYKDYQIKKYSIIEPETNKDSLTKILINTSPCTKIFRRDFLLEKDGWFDEGIIYEDLALIPYLVSQSKKDLFINECLYNYVYRDNSIMNNNKTFKSNRDDKFKSLKRLIERFKESNKFSKYFDELEFLMIRHLLIVYSSEILIYKKNIYKNRCIDVLNELNSFNANWINNKYLKEMSILKKTYVFLFRKRMFFICKLIVIILRKVGRI